MQKVSDEEAGNKAPTKKEGGERSLGVLGLTALLFFNVGGGPFGTEGLQQAGGPFFSVIGLLILSVVWSLPVGLMTAELGTAFPRDGGYVLWVEAAFGEFWAFQVRRAPAARNLVAPPRGHGTCVYILAHTAVFFWRMT
jgi:amino acid transporter